jgi:hypothetical protein
LASSPEQTTARFPFPVADELAHVKKTARAPQTVCYVVLFLVTVYRDYIVERVVVGEDS